MKDIKRSINELESIKMEMISKFGRTSDSDKLGSVIDGLHSLLNLYDINKRDVIINLIDGDLVIGHNYWGNNCTFSNIMNEFMNGHYEKSDMDGYSYCLEYDFGVLYFEPIGASVKVRFIKN